MSFTLLRPLHISDLVCASVPTKTEAQMEFLSWEMCGCGVSLQLSMLERLRFGLQLTHTSKLCKGEEWVARHDSHGPREVGGDQKCSYMCIFNA